MNQFKPFVSVVIPVYNDTERLRLCLNALNEQTYPEDRFEVIVVDNNSDPEIDNSIGNQNNLVLTSEKTQSLSAARNRGLSISKGEILAFTDADCIPNSDWIEKGVQYLIDHPDCGLAGGKIEVFPRFPENPTAVELYEILFAFPQEKYINSSRFAATANIFTRKCVIEDVGLFDPSIISGSDAEWGKRVFRRGYQVSYYAGAIVRHPARRTLKEKCRKTIRVMNGIYSMSSKSETSEFINAIKIFRNLVPPLITSVKLFNKDEVRKLGSLDKRLKVIIVFIVLRYVKTFEKIRLLLGGKPRYYF